LTITLGTFNPSRRLFQLRYPSLNFAIGMTIIWYQVANWLGFGPATRYSVLSCDFILPVLWFLAPPIETLFTRLTRHETENEEKTHGTTFAELSKSPKRLLEWINIESPIEHPSDDVFGFRQAAEQVANLIRQHPDHTFGLIGEFGSGKSSFLRLVTHFITEANQKNSTPRIITCSASLWGRDETSSIVTILRESVSELAKHVDVTALARLPENYIAAMGYTSPPWWFSFIFWSHIHSNPIHHLKRLDRILKAINTHLVIYIEDADRNVPQDKLPERLVELQAMLDQLRSNQCTNLSFVLAVGSAGGAVTFDFIQDHINFLLDDPNHIKDERKNHVLKEWNHRITDCSTHQRHAIGGWPRNYATFGSSPVSIKWADCSICTTCITVGT